MLRSRAKKLSAKFGGRDNWHRPLVLEQGLKASPWTLTPAEMDFLNSSKMTRDEILDLIAYVYSRTSKEHEFFKGDGHHHH